LKRRDSIKKLPKIEVSYAVLQDMATAPIRSRMLTAGLELGVFDEMNDYRSADDIGTGYDLIRACATLNFARHDLDTLIGKVHCALNSGGVFIAFQDGMTHERTQPDTMLGHLGDALRSVQDFSFDQGEIAASMLRCGFRSVHSQTIDTPMGAMDLDIARKER